MKTQESAVKQEVAESSAIKPIGEIATVQPSGIVNKRHVATKEMVATYCKAIKSGMPTGKIFPARLGEMEFSIEQRQEIRHARKEHRVACMADKKGLIKVLQAKTTFTVGHSQNAKETRGAVKYVKRNAFLDKVGKFSQAKFDKFVEGSAPKTKPATA